MLKQTVLEAARERIAWLFDEFENDIITVSFSGGKDSTVTLALALDEAERRGRLPLPVVFIDQEAEWGATIEYVRAVMYDPRVEPYWLQVPIKLFNSASMSDTWLMCWDEGQKEKWIHPKDPIAITENKYGTDRFKELFSAFSKTTWPDRRVLSLGGVRTEESPNRYAGLTGQATYKWATWGKRDNKNTFAMYPLYDWSYTDIWKFIHERNLPYCKVYDYMYQRGVPVLQMRVSNLHHETAVHNLYYLQEVEKETWNRLVDRLGGVAGVRHIKKKDMFSAGELPFMFDDWRQYRDHLLDKLVTDETAQKAFAKRFADDDKAYAGMLTPEVLWKAQVAAIMTNDYHMTKMDNFRSKPEAREFRKWRAGKGPINPKFAKWIPKEVTT